jgi:hypothetical protein
MMQRAPRLRPDQRLADSITRLGRFAKIDPRKGRKLPRLVHIAGAIAWLGLVVESFRRARAASRTAETDSAQPEPSHSR